MIFPKSWHNHIKGQAMVEMAFVLSVLVLLAFGITEFGRAMYTKNTITNAARAGARQAVVTPGLTNTSNAALTLTGNNCTYSNPSGENLVLQAVCSSLYSGINKSNVRVTISGPNPTATSGDTITVTVTCNFASVVPRLFGPGAIPFPSTLTGAAAMRYE